jgi:hypothetical protein
MSKHSEAFVALDTSKLRNAVARVTRIGRAEPQARRVSHEQA